MKMLLRAQRVPKPVVGATGVKGSDTVESLPLRSDIVVSDGK
jgi:hypothetical protein